MLATNGQELLLIEINGQKLKELRGNRSLAEIVEASERAFSDVALMKWEKGKTQPKTDNIKVLMKVYNVKIEDIVKPAELALS
jgi:transcriptional regulator with XRE-family HTH domain